MCWHLEYAIPWRVNASFLYRVCLCLTSASSLYSGPIPEIAQSKNVTKPMMMTLMIIHIICSESSADDDNVDHDDSSVAAADSC